uniref:von Willebrand factor A domain-containing protein 1 n=1 Tax=Geotrypetes seraphini TaxID=260995 RepID=A0A6P8PV93_GEOSA|nr:von Willebrand factor A domain-containing protein 1 isoform X3 [Geotrypetes seraphini]
MIARLALWLHFLHQIARGQHLPGADPPPFIPDCEGDILFLLDSSGSVSYYEFANVKGFIGGLLQPFTFGPNDVQTSIIHISTTPVLEFPFNQHASSHAVQKAIQDTKQYMGDTNTGQALSFAKEKLFTEQAGARASVPKVLVWVTDGISTDDIAEPMKLLKDMGVTVFVVSTGRGNYRELSAAASEPPEDHLHFVDVDDLPIITKSLRDSIIEASSPAQILISDSRAHSFQVSWSPTPDNVVAYHVLYGPLPGNSVELLEVEGTQNSTMVEHLMPNTTYLVTVAARYKSGKEKALSAKACTQEEHSKVRHLRFEDVGPNSLKASWEAADGNVLGYQVRCRRQAGSLSLLSVPAQVHNIVLTDLAAGTPNKICVKPMYRNTAGRRLCRTVHTEAATSTKAYEIPQPV